MKSNTSKLSSKGFIYFNDLLYLIVKLIVLHKHLHSWLTTAQHNIPKNLES
jgi:hypothetical protein